MTFWITLYSLCNMHYYIHFYRATHMPRICKAQYILLVSGIASRCSIETIERIELLSGIASSSGGGVA